ncbi:MAG: hypothetical protein WB791_02835 [Waddliaceae bacterium]
MAYTFLSSRLQDSCEAFQALWNRQPNDHKQHLPVRLSSDTLCLTLSFLSNDRDFASTFLVCREWKRCTEREWNKFSELCLKTLFNSQELLHSHCSEEERERIFFNDAIPEIDANPETIEERRKLYFSRKRLLVMKLSFLAHQRLEDLKGSPLSSPITLELLENAQQSVYGSFHAHPHKKGKIFLMAEYRRVGRRKELFCQLAPRVNSRNRWGDNDPRYNLLRKLKPIPLKDIASIREGEVLGLRVDQYRLHLTCNQKGFAVYYPDGTVVDSLEGIEASVAKYGPRNILNIPLFS